MYICEYIQTCVYIYIYICIPLSIKREREKPLKILNPGAGTAWIGLWINKWCQDRRRENMVGVNMVLAEYHQIQAWLLWIYVLSAIWGCFDGVLLKPCLLQPCFHLAGQGSHLQRAQRASDVITYLVCLDVPLYCNIIISIVRIIHVYIYIYIYMFIHSFRTQSDRKIAQVPCERRRSYNPGGNKTEISIDLSAPPTTSPQTPPQPPRRDLCWQ